METRSDQLSVELIRCLQNLERIRKARKISQEVLADELGVSYQTLQRWSKSDYLNTRVRDFLIILKYFENNQQ